MSKKKAGATTQFAEVEVKNLIKADWNYKSDGTEEEIAHLAKSINKWGTAGVFAVRVVEKDGEDKLEVMDGNHRLDAVRLLGWDYVRIENFGKIDQADAFLVAAARNEQWFEDDKMKKADLYADVVFNKYSIEEVSSFSPEKIETLKAYEEMAKIEWHPPAPPEEANTFEGEIDGKKTIKVVVEEEVYNLWVKWLERAEEVTGIDSPARAIEFAIIEALNVPEQQLTSEFKNEP